MMHHKLSHGAWVFVGASHEQGSDAPGRAYSSVSGTLGSRSSSSQGDPASCRQRFTRRGGCARMRRQQASRRVPLARALEAELHLIPVVEE
jgi:hypothetical protein